MVTLFENDYAALEEVRKEKRTKYDHISDQYRQQGYDVFVDAFVFGALDGWDLVNERIINCLSSEHTTGDR
jgi:hypothetical protein